MKPVSPEVSFPKLEHQTLDEWTSRKTREQVFKPKPGQKEFAFYDGPPFANGLPHYGHLLASTIKDSVSRYWSMLGYFVERRFGWDCHGVPVEYEIEKRHNLKGKADILAMGIDKFNEECRENVQHYTGEWQKTITRMGRWVDWSDQYRTMDKDFMESVWWVFSELYRKGLVYRDFKVVPYSPRITAVLSNFEANQNYKEVQDPAITVKLKLKDEDAFLLAWTTTPWTLISNLALCIGPEIDYVKVRHKESGEVYYLAKARVSALFKKSKGKESPVEELGAVAAADLAGRQYEPLFPYFKDHDNAFTVVVDDYVTTDDGTGIVHQAPAYGEDDFRVCRANKIELVDPLDDEGKFKTSIPEYQGQYVKDADKAIIQDLKANGALVKHDTLVHRYPFCERTDEPLIYRAIDSWYVNVEKIKDQLIANNQTINWVPDHLRDGRMGKWLEGARDWAISRNRYWGTPIPIWVCENDRDHLEVLGSAKDLEDKAGVKVDDLHIHFIDKHTFDCPHCDGKMKRIAEVFDCWFESGSMPYAQNHYPFENEDRFQQRFPADFIAEGLDQTRGWFYTLSVLSAALYGKPAFKNVVVNGLILAEDGKKMSKRLKNYTPPEALLNEFGADSVRLYMLNSAVLKAGDLAFTDKGVRDTTRAVLLPLWNVYSFLSTYADADGWQPTAQSGDVAPDVSNELDRWLISRFQTLCEDVHEQMERYRLFAVVPEVIDFIDDLTNWYLRQSRKRFWGSSEQGLADDSRQAYETLYYVLNGFVKIFAPFAPFISDSIYKLMTDGLNDLPESVHLCEIPKAQAELRDEALERRMDVVRRATNLGRSLRAKHKIKTRQVLPSIMIITHNDDDQVAIKNGEGIIKGELNIKQIEFSTDEARYVKLGLKPNLRTLGQRLGKQLNDVRQELMTLSKDPDRVVDVLGKLGRDGFVEINGHKLTEDDFLIDRGPKDDRLIATEAGVTVLLDTTLTDDLVLEGLAREVVNRIQKLRKDSGLNISDRIALEVTAEGKLADAVASQQNYIATETLAARFSTQAGELKGLKFTESYNIEGTECRVSLGVESAAN